MLYLDKLYSIFHLFFYDDHKKLHIHEYENNSKQLLVYSNIIYLIVFLLILKQDIPNKILAIFLLLTVFATSTFYHYIQCNHDNYNYYCNSKLCDVSVVIGATLLIILLVKIKLNIFLILLIIIAIYFFMKYETLDIYIYSHSIWHVLTGIIIYFIFTIQ